MKSINQQYSLVPFDGGTLIVDKDEKDYGKNTGILFLNESGTDVLKMLLSGKSVNEIVLFLSQADMNGHSQEAIKESVCDILNQLESRGVFEGTNTKAKCNPLEKVGFGPIKGRLTIKRQPLIGVIEITPICNCNCPHCYVKGFTPQGWLKTEQFKEIASIFRDKGVVNVTLTGGEPLSHPDFKEIYLAYKEKGFLIDIFTNGLLIDEDLAQFLSKNPPRSLDITLYGTSNEEYYDFTGVRNGYYLLIQALDLLKKYGVYFTTKTILTKQNYNNLTKFNQIALEYNAPFRYNVVLGRGNNTIKDPEEIALTPQQVIDIEKKDPLRRVFFNTINDFCTNLPYDFNKEQCPQYLCGAGLDKVFIGYNGIMSPCMTLRGKGLDLFKYGFDYVWHYWGEQRKKHLSRSFKCLDCEFLSICTPCTEEFEQIEGDKEKPIQSRCDLAELRWKEFIDFTNKQNERVAKIKRTGSNN